MRIRHCKRTWIAAAAAVAAVGLGGTGVVLAAEPPAPPGTGMTGAQPVQEQAGLIPDQPTRNCTDEDADRADYRFGTGGDDGQDRVDDDRLDVDDRFDDDRNGVDDDRIDDCDDGGETDDRVDVDDDADDGQDD